MLNVTTRVPVTHQFLKGHSKLTATACGLAVALAGLTGCGGGSDADPGRTSAASTHPEPSAHSVETLVVGSVAPSVATLLPPASTPAAGQPDPNVSAAVSAGPGGSYLPPVPQRSTTAPRSHAVPASSSPHAPSTTPAQTHAAGDADEQAIRAAYDQYLYVYSGLMAYLNRTWIPPLTEVATQDLSTATVRAAAAIKHAQEHGVGQLHHSKVSVTRTAGDRASIADCQDQLHFYLVSDKTGKPDPAVTRGYFVGAVNLVKVDGHWLVSTYTTTHQECES